MSREGSPTTAAVSKEVKEKILYLFQKQSLTRVSENDYSVLAYSQFYRVCSNKWGMGNQELKNKFDNQEAYYR